MWEDGLEGDDADAMETVSAEMPLSLRLIGRRRVVWVQASSNDGEVLPISATMPLSETHKCNIQTNMNNFLFAVKNVRFIFVVHQKQF